MLSYKKSNLHKNTNMKGIIDKGIKFNYNI